MVIDMNMVNLPEIKTIKLKELTAAQINSACLSYRHDFGLLPIEEQNLLRNQCKWWFEAISREF